MPTRPTLDIDRTISEYYMAGEIAATMAAGMNLVVPEQRNREPVRPRLARSSFAWRFCGSLSRVDLRIFSKTTRGPKKPPTPRTKFKGKPHVSTAKLLAAAMADRK